MMGDSTSHNRPDEHESFYKTRLAAVDVRKSSESHALRTTFLGALRDKVDSASKLFLKTVIRTTRRAFSNWILENFEVHSMHDFCSILL